MPHLLRPGDGRRGGRAGGFGVAEALRFQGLELLAQAASPGSHGTQMRSYLRAMSRETWDLVNWLTHAANAKRSDADAAVDATSHLLQVFSLALIREKRGEPERCPDCGSYQVTTNYRRSGDEEAGAEAFPLCEACGWESDDSVDAA